MGVALGACAETGQLLSSRQAEIRWTTLTINQVVTMIRSRFLRSSVLVLSAFIAVSCSDFSPTAPPPPAATVAKVEVQPDADLLGGLVGGILGIVTGLLGSVLHV